MKLYHMSILYKINWIKIIYLFFLLLPIINGLGDKVLHEFCPHIYNEQIQNCVLPVSQYAKILHQQSGQSMSTEFNQAISIPKVGKDVFYELCRLIRNFDTCIFKLREECPKHITINLIDASYGYLCNEAHDIFLNSAECLMELDLQPDIKQCHDETLHEIEKISATTAITLHLKLDRMCSALNYFSSCVMIPIKEKCGNEAWHVIHHVLKHTTKTLMPGCIFINNRHTEKHHVKNIHIHGNIDNHSNKLEKQSVKLDNNNDDIVINYIMNQHENKNYNENEYKENSQITNQKNDNGIKSRIEKNEDVVEDSKIFVMNDKLNKSLITNHEKYQKEEFFENISKNIAHSNNTNIILKVMIIIFIIFCL